MAGKESLDEVGGFGVESEASKLLSENVVVNEVEEPGNVEHESCGFEASAPSVVDILREGQACIKGGRMRMSAKLGAWYNVVVGDLELDLFGGNLF